MAESPTTNPQRFIVILQSCRYLGGLCDPLFAMKKHAISWSTRLVIAGIATHIYPVPKKKDIPKPVYYIFHVFRGFHVIHRCLPSTSTPSTPMAPFPFGVPTILRNFWTSPGRSRSAEFESWSIQLSEAIQAPPTPTQQVQHSTAVVGQFVPLGRSSQKSATKRNM